MKTLRKLFLVVLVCTLIASYNTTFADKIDLQNPYNPPVLADWGGPDMYGYLWYDSDEVGGPTYSWVDISSIGTPVGLDDDSTSIPIDIGFDFDFYGNTFSTVRVCSNGWVTFTSTSHAYNNTEIPNSSEPNNLLAVFWDDLNPDSGGTVYSYTDLDNDRFIVSYDGVPHYRNYGALYFQVILYTDGTILYQYGSMEDGEHGNNGATIGIENAAGDDGLQVVRDADYIHDDMAIIFVMEPMLDYDVGPTVFLSPTGVGHVGEPFTPSVTFMNYGSEDATFDVNLVITYNEQTVYEETGTITSLETFETYDYSFPAYTPEDGGDFTLTATSSLAGDENTTNDLLETTFYVEPDILPPTGLRATSYQDGVVPLAWYEPGNIPCTYIQYDDGTLANAFYYYAAANLIASSFVAVAPIQVCTVNVHVLTEGDPYWPWPDATHDPLHITIWDEANGQPNSIVGEATATAAPGEELVIAFEPPVSVETDMFWVAVNNILDTDPYEGIGLDAVTDFPEHKWIRLNDVWQNTGPYDGDRMIRASIISSGVNALLTENNPEFDGDVILDTQELTGYNVYRDTMANVPVEEAYRIAQDVQATEYDDENVTNGTTYYYVVTAVYDDTVESIPSNEVSGMPAGGGNMNCDPTEIIHNAPPGDIYTVHLELSNTGDLDVNFAIAPVINDMLYVVGQPPYTTMSNQAKYTSYVDDSPKTFVPHEYSPPVVTNEGGPDAFGYVWLDSDEPNGPTYNWIDPSGHQAIPMSDDDNEGPFGLEFPFPFYGQLFNSLRICSNGFISFTSTLTSYDNLEIPNPAAPLNMIAPFWDDHNPASSGTVYWYCDEDMAIISWVNVPHYDVGGPYTYQAILYPSGKMLFQYNSMNSPVDSATIGIQDAAGEVGLQVVYNAGYIYDGLATMIKPGWLTVDPRVGVIPAEDDIDIDVIMDATDLLNMVYTGQLIITCSDINGELPEMTVPVTLDLITGVDDAALIPTTYSLAQNYPNPFNASTSIKFALAKAADVELVIYNMLGQKVAMLADEYMEAGYHSLVWNAADISSGMYFYKLTAGDYSEIQQMTLIK